MKPRTSSIRLRISLRTVACATGVCAAFLVWASSCFAYSFGPTVTATGPEQTVFDWSAQACQQLDIPDEPARAFRDSTGRVQLLASHYITRRFIGPDLNSVQHSCSILLSSVRNAEPAAFNDKVWVASPYTRNGRTIYALLNDEYQGWTHPNMCDPSYSSSTPLRCWYNAITFASSKNNGNSYEIAPLSGRIVASLPYPYQSGPGPYGYFQPSNIVYNAADSYYYVMVASYAQYQDQAEGACLLRTKTPGNSASWLAWDGSAFSVSFVNPYASPGTPSTGHVCAPVAVDRIGTMTSSLTYNTYFGKYMLVGTETLYNPKTGKNVSGFFYSLSSDLITWGPARLLMTANFPWAYTCTKASEKPVYDPSVLDPNSTSRNFETTGQTMNLYYVRANFNGCSWGLDRDLVRIPIKFIVGGTAPTSSVARPSDVTPQSSTAPAPSAAAAPPGDSTATDSPPPNSDSPGG